MASKRHPIIGMKFGEWTVISTEERGVGYPNKRWFCECSCKKQKWNKVCSLYRKGIAKRCGSCAQQENNIIHDCSKTRLYKIWTGMKNRCYNPNQTKFANYGGKGILVCDEWKQNFTCFKEWANGNGYNDTLLIDRIKVNEGYCPNNCRFVTSRQSRTNRGAIIKSKSGYKGVRKIKNRWTARISTDGKEFFLGSFLTKEEAALAYNKKAKELFGDFSCLNEINN